MATNNSKEDRTSIEVTSLVGMLTKEARVQMVIMGECVQMTSDEARDLAFNLLACAESAEADLFLVGFAFEKIGTDMTGAAQLLKEFRDWRHRTPEPEVSDGNE